MYGAQLVGALTLCNAYSDFLFWRLFHSSTGSADVPFMNVYIGINACEKNINLSGFPSFSSRDAQQGACAHLHVFVHCTHMYVDRVAKYI